MKKLILLGAFLMLGSITNKGFAQMITSASEATIMSVSPDKMTGFVYSPKLGSVIEFVNETLVDVLPGDKVLIIAPTAAEAMSHKPTKITFGGGSTDAIRH